MASPEGTNFTIISVAVILSGQSPPSAESVSGEQVQGADRPPYERDPRREWSSLRDQCTRAIRVVSDAREQDRFP